MGLQAAEEGTSGASSVSGSSVNDPDDSFSDKDGDKDAKKKKNRCATCRKKVGLTGELFDKIFDKEFP